MIELFSPLYSTKFSIAISTQIFKWYMLTKLLLRHSSPETYVLHISFLEQIKFLMVQILIEPVRIILGGGPFPLTNAGMQFYFEKS